MIPPPHIVDRAVEVSGMSPCRSKRGVVIFTEGRVISRAYNYKPRGFECDGSAACKATCRREAVHAEQQALMTAGDRAHASEMLHVKTVDGKLVPSGGPSCVECSKLARAAGIAWVWLYHADGWRRYDGADFHRQSIAASPVVEPAAPPEGPQQLDEQTEHRLRQYLWLSHGHQGQYGDDGEMQCVQCAPEWDYKRAPLRDVIAQAVKASHEVMLAALSASRTEPQDDDESLHTGDDERLDAVTNIVSGLEAMRDDPEDNPDITFSSIIEDCHALDALLLATIKRERAASRTEPEGTRESK